jgi:hypothetical protein
LCIFDNAFRCDACGRLSIASWVGTDDRKTDLPSSRERWRQIRWHPIPTLSMEFPDVPEPIANAAAEATLCLSVQAYRGACSLARAVVEATAKDRGHTTGSLMAKIDALHAAGMIRAKIAEAAHLVRLLGNDMAHGDFTQSVEREEAEETVSLMTLLLDEVYQQDATIARLRAARLTKSGGAP